MFGLPGLGDLFGGGGGGSSFESGGIGNSKSENTSSQTTTYTDSRMVLGEGAAYVSDSNKNNTSTINATNSGNTWNTVIDANAVGLAFKGINDTVKAAFGFGSDALDFAQASNTLALGEVNKAIAFAQDTQQRSFAESASSLGAATQAMGQALAFGSKQTAQALDSLNTSANLVKDAYADAKGRGAMTDYLLLAVVAVAGILAWRAAR